MTTTARVPKTRPGEPSPPSFNPNLPVAEQVLANAQTSREVVQEFCPLAESLEWELGQQYLRERGNKAFISDASPVPFVVNNDGTLSRNAAEVFFANLVESEKTAPLEDQIFVLELGIGVGLFARFFLDNFRDLCQKHGKDYYDRLCYIAADRSERMLTDVLRHGVLGKHPGHYRVRLVDAMEPEKYLLADPMFSHRPGKPLRAVFLNYLLDCLPAAVLELDKDAVRQLYVRTCVARNVQLKGRTDMTLKMLQARAVSKDPKAKQELLEVYGLFASEYDYRPVDAATLPYGNFALEFAQRMSKRMLHNYGALQCLEKLLGLVHDDGMILINDYGQTQVTRDDEFEHQRFSLATFVGVNFSLLKEFFSDKTKYGWVEPPGEGRGIHSRLLGHKIGSETYLRFYERFGEAANTKLQEPLHKARTCLKMGRFELAAGFYREALDQQPRNWVLLNEISMFLIFNLRDIKAGVDMARAALRLNPTCSAELWNTLGDGLYEWGNRTEEARSAYQKAMKVNSADVRSRYNLAWVHTRLKEYPQALDMIAQAMSLDKTGEFRDRLLHKQQEVLMQMNQKNQQEYLLLINLVSKYAGQDKDEEGAPTKPPAVPDKTE